ncbi:MAG: CPBP family intramembrane metalloprotease [Clostridia bacterium]|nr:CPBP family intramembrane metalloprotease [Clostridia bacterium]
MAFETQRLAVAAAASHVKTDLKRDISAVFAAASLLIALLYLSECVLWLLRELASPAASAVSRVFACDYESALASYRSFISSDVFLASLELVCYAVGMILPFLLIKRFASAKPRSWFPLAPRMPQKAFSFFAFASGLTLGVNFLCTLLFERFYPNVSSSAPAGPVSRFVLVLMMVLLAPVAEELIFRGAVYGTLARYSQPFAIFVSALAFALAHRNPPQVINAFVLGVFLALAYAKTGSIAPCVFIHVINNSFSVMVQYYSAYHPRGLFIILTAIGVLALGVFTAARLIVAAAKRRLILTLYDDTSTALPRLDKKSLTSALALNAFLWAFIAITAAGVWVLYE